MRYAIAATSRARADEAARLAVRVEAFQEGRVGAEGPRQADGPVRERAAQHAVGGEAARRREHRGGLDDRERNIIMFRFGLNHETEPQTLEQLGGRFGVTKERIRQLESRALGKLRKIALEEKLDIPGI